MAARSNTLPDALALAMVNNGWFNFCQPHVRAQLWGHYKYADTDHIIATGQSIVLTDSGNALLEQSPLWTAHQRLLAMGYERDRGRDPIRPRRASKRYIPYQRWNDTTNRYDSAWISASRRKPTIYISRPQSEGGTYQLEDK